MKILIVNTAFPPDVLGGAERSVLELAQSYAERGASVLVVALAPPATGAQDAGNDWNFRVRRLETRRFGRYAGQSKQTLWTRSLHHLGELFRLQEYIFLRREIRRFRPDVIHFNNLAGFGFLAWIAGRRVSSVQTVRDYSLLCTSATGRHGSIECNRRAIRCRILKLPFTFRRFQPSVVVGVSAYVADRLSRNGVRGTSLPNQTIYNAPDVAPHSVDCRPAPRTEVIFGYLGRISSDKGVAVLLGAAAELSKIRRTEVHLAGEVEPHYLKWIYQTFQGLVESGSIIYKGVCDPVDFYQSVDIAVVPTQWEEPFGRSAAEALILGKPLIYSVVGGLPEVHRYLGGAGIGVYAPESISEWVGALERARAGRWEVSPAPGELQNPADRYMSFFDALVT